MLSILFILVGLALLLQLKNKLLAFLFIISAEFYFPAYDLRELVFVQNLFVSGIVSDYTYYLIFGLFIWLSIIIILVIDNQIESNIIRRNNFITQYTYFESRLILAFYVLSLLSISAFLINFSRVDFSYSMLVLNPREYEYTFGSSIFWNYLYFLNIPAICSYIFIRVKYNRLNSKINLVLVFILLIVSFFHGIKFTVFDTFIFPVFFYYYVSLKPIKFKNIFLISLVLFAFYLSFSYLVRGSGGSPIEQLISYVLPNYYNLAYSIQENKLQWSGLSLFLPDKIPDIFSQLYKYGPTGFALNEKFNMQTAYSNYYSFANMFGPLIFLSIVTFVRFLFRNKFRKGIFQAFLLAYIDYCFLFVFFFHAFNKTKYVYYLAILFFIHILTKKHKKLAI